MNRIFLISIVLFISSKVMGQFAIINDKDGYTNVREDKSPTSEIIGRLFNDDVFLYAEEDESDEWINIFYSADIDKIEPYKKDFYIKQLKFTTNHIYFNGYVHKSRLLPIESLNNLIQTRQLSNEELILKNDSIVFTIKTGQFIAANHKLERAKEGWVEKIDGNYPRGVDGGLPKVEIKNISLNIDSKSIEIPKVEYSDLYELNLKNIKIYADKRGVIYIYMPYNSDGAGGYFAVWIIKENKYLKRYVDML